MQQRSHNQDLHRIPVKSDGPILKGISKPLPCKPLPSLKRRFLEESIFAYFRHKRDSFLYLGGAVVVFYTILLTNRLSCRVRIVWFCLPLNN